MSLEDRRAGRCKPTAALLGVNLEALAWQRSGSGEGSFEVAFVADAGAGAVPGRPAADPGAAGAGAVPGRQPANPGGAGDLPAVDWVLLRVAGDPAGRVLVYDRLEWGCFLDGARSGEFDADSPGQRAPLPTDQHFSN
jgi:hypothetical protein